MNTYTISITLFWIVVIFVVIPILIGLMESRRRLEPDELAVLMEKPIKDTEAINIVANMRMTTHYIAIQILKNSILDDPEGLGKNIYNSTGFLVPRGYSDNRCEECKNLSLHCSVLCSQKQWVTGTKEFT